MRRDDLHTLPPGLPVPMDDGACDHLPGARVPPIALRSTRGRLVRLDQVETSWAIVFAYPRTGLPDVDVPPAWDAIPGARGCTPQACAYRDQAAAFRALGATVFGLSTQSPDYQREMAERLGLPFEVLSDEGLALTRALNLPTFAYEDWTLLKRHTLAIFGGRIERVFYPVFPPDADAATVLAWLGEHAR
jgi:peroxiredoxin